MPDELIFYMKWLWDFRRKRKAKPTKQSNLNNAEEDIINDTFQLLKNNFRQEVS